MKKLLCYLIISVVPCLASAQFVSGSKLVEMVQADGRMTSGNASLSDGNKSMMLIGFLQGVSDALNGTYFCLPPGATAGQIIAVVQKHVAARPEDWNQSGAVLAATALALAFPCQK